MKPDQERVKNLLTDTVSLLCRNGLAYQDALKVEGLIGITLDNNEVFLVHINQTFSTGAGVEATPLQLPAIEETAPPQVTVAPEIKDRKRPLNSQPPPSPSSHSDSTGSPSPPVVEGVKIKQEPDLVFVKTEKFDSPAPGRVPPLHGTADVSQSLSMSNRRTSSSNFSNDMGDNMSGPPAKRRASGDPVGAGAFVTGMVRNINSGNMPWTNPTMAPDISQGNNSQMSMDAFAGCSNWSPGGGGGMDPNATLNPNDPAMQMLLFPMKQRRSATDPNKPYKCDYPGCGRSFFHRQNLWHHRRNMGHAKAKRDQVQPTPGMLTHAHRPREDHPTTGQGFQSGPQHGFMTDQQGFGS